MDRSFVAALDQTSGIASRLKSALPRQDFRADIVKGLGKIQKETPAKYLYDKRGSELFQEICDLPEYYPTRTEISILEQSMDQIAAMVGPGARIIEFGPGTSVKTRMLVEAVRPSVYVPIDISETALVEASEQLGKEFPWLNISAVCADFTRIIRLPNVRAAGRSVLFFPGSTIGNFTPMDALTFLRNAHSYLPRGGLLLIGVDLEKDKSVLDAAYNDAAGVTAAFNMNLLERINRELDASFDLSRYQHKAFYAPDKRRVEMHLLSLCAQRVVVAGRVFMFRAGETILTEISCKYAISSFQLLARAAGFHPEAVWTDPADLFSVHVMSTG